MKRNLTGDLLGLLGGVTLLFGRRTGLSKLPKRDIRIRFRGFLTEYLQSVISNLALVPDIQKSSLIVTCCSCLPAPVVQAATFPVRSSSCNSLALKSALPNLHAHHSPGT